ncbi:MAG: hypothetical protein U0163_19225 [Gemmatimonadaceae bacterium]
MLLLLSAGGVPLTGKELATCLSVEVSTVEQHLMQLASLRLASPAGDAWTLSRRPGARHGARQDQARQTRAAHLGLADALQHEHEWSVHLARRIAQHLWVGGDRSGVRQLFQRYAAESRA